MNHRRLLMAYADPPYPGQSAKHYADHPDYAGEVDHGALIDRLLSDYPDGWALSTSSPALYEVQHLLAERDFYTRPWWRSGPADYRVMAWVKPFAAYKRNVRVAYTWEPVVVRPAERLEGAQPTRDHIAESITLKRGLTGVKPERFCHWLFAAMGLRPTDELHDLFPGSGAVSQAWERWTQQLDVAA